MGMSSEATQISDAAPSDVVSTGMQVTHPGVAKAAVEQLPNGWKFTALGEFAAFRTGPFGSALHKSDYIDDGIPVINPMHIVDGALLPESQASVSERAAKRLADFQFKRDDIVMGRRGDMGRCAVVRESQVGWLCGTGSLIIRCIGDVDVAFLQRVLTTERIVGLIEASSVGSTMVNLNQAALARLPIQCPPLREQRAIAEALSDVDGLLEALEALIAKKRAIKEAAMQQLLTGKTRLPGFSGEWETKSLDQVATRITGFWGADGLSQRATNPVGVIRAGDISALGELTGFAQRYFSDSELAKAVCRIGDVVMTVSGNGLGKTWLFDGRAPLAASNFVRILRANPAYASAPFLSYALKGDTATRLLAEHTATSAYPNLGQGFFSTVWLALPQIAEQSAIASVLSDMDAEIAALEARREKTRAIKQGMMQQLLTGRVRLMKPEAAPAC
jgi:type I restriction enzyme S subunit